MVSGHADRQTLHLSLRRPCGDHQTNTVVNDIMIDSIICIFDTCEWPASVFIVLGMLLLLAVWS